MNRNILSTQQVADMTGLSINTFRAWRAQSKGPRWFKLGQRCFYKREDIEAWIEQQYATTGAVDHSA